MTENSTSSPRNKRKTLVVLLALAAVVVGAGAAFAYWTTGGTGTGSAATGSGTADLIVNQTSVVTDLRPGGAAQPLSGDFDNNGASPAYVGTVTASIASVAKAVGAPTGPCSPADYTLAHPAMIINAEVPVGAAQGAWGTLAPEVATLAFNNTTSNQDGCKGATVTLSYTIS